MPRTFKFNPTPEPFEVIQGGLSTRGPGRPQKSTDSVAQEKIGDIDKLRDLGIDFSFNRMTGQIEFTGKDGSTEILEGSRLLYLGSELAMRFGESLPDQRLKPALHYLAHENIYDPRIRFLEHCCEEYEPSEDIHKISSIYFNNDNEFCNRAMTRFLVGLVARVYNPGCSMSWLPILIGEQGLGKSQFSRSLVPEEMFAEMNADISVLIRESYRLHSSWILELPEIDNYFKPRHAEDLKSLITLQVDEVRRPYELPSKAKRSFGFIGTSNQPQLLVDSTGNRRFVPIAIPSGFRVPWRQLVQERGGLWAAAVQLYRSHHPWEFSSGELAELRTYSDQFLERDSWFDAIQNYVVDKDNLTTAQILELCLDIPVSRTHNGDQRRAGSVMRALGWEQTSRRINGKSKRVWKRTDKAQPQVDGINEF